MSFGRVWQSLSTVWNGRCGWTAIRTGFSGQVIQNGAILYSDANLFSGWFAAELWTPSRMAVDPISFCFFDYLFHVVRIQCNGNASVIRKFPDIMRFCSYLFYCSAFAFSCLEKAFKNSLLKQLEYMTEIFLYLIL
jgi:hypothetical protein